MPSGSASERSTGGNPAALNAHSRAPLNRRPAHRPSELIAAIKALRTQFPNLGKTRLRVLLAERGLNPPSAATIGRIIKADRNKMRQASPAPARPNPHASRLAFALAVPRANSQWAARFAQLVQVVFPFPIQNVLTDNGSEFAGTFEQAVKKNHQQHFHTYPPPHTYPKTPKKPPK